MNNKVLYISPGAGFLPSTICRCFYVNRWDWSERIPPRKLSLNPKIVRKEVSYFFQPKTIWDIFSFHFLIFSFLGEIPVLPLVVHKSIQKRYSIGLIYGRFSIYHTNQLNVGKWTVNWSDGYGTPCLKKIAWAQVSRQAYTAPGRPSEDVQWHSVEL